METPPPPGTISCGGQCLLLKCSEGTMWCWGPTVYKACVPVLCSIFFALDRCFKHNYRTDTSEDIEVIVHSSQKLYIDCPLLRDLMSKVNIFLQGIQELLGCLKSILKNGSKMYSFWSCWPSKYLELSKMCVRCVLEARYLTGRRVMFGRSQKFACFQITWGKIYKYGVLESETILDLGLI